MSSCDHLLRLHAPAPSRAARSRRPRGTRRGRAAAAPPRRRGRARAHGIAQLLDDRGDVLGRHRLAIAMVDRDERRRRAAAEALDRAQGDGAVARRLAGRDSELELERLEHRLRVDEPAADVRAHLDRVRPDRLEMEHVVEARHRHAVRGREVERLAHLFERLAREPAVLLLREPQRREDRRLRLRVLLRDRPDVLDERAHRSVSPMTASSEPTTAMRSAMSVFCAHVAVAWSAAKDGARKCTRHGFGPPSLTT